MSNELSTSLSPSKANTSIARWYAVQVAGFLNLLFVRLLFFEVHQEIMDQTLLLRQFYLKIQV